MDRLNPGLLYYAEISLLSFRLVRFRSSNIAMKLGIINNVNTVDTNNPKRMTLARGAHVSEVPPSPNAIGINPEIVVMDVRIMGRKRSLPASTILLQIR